VMAEIVLMVDEGRIDALDAGGNGVILGRTLAALLGVRIDDTGNVLVPRFERGQPGARLFGLAVEGVFDAGVPDHTTGLALMHLHDASVLDGLDGRPEGLAVRLDDALAVDAFPASIADLLEGSDLRYSDWTEEHASYFTA